MNLAKSKKTEAQEEPKMIRRQLGYVKQDLETIDRLLQKSPTGLTEKQQEQPEVIQKLYEPKK